MSIFHDDGTQLKEQNINALNEDDLEQMDDVSRALTSGLLQSTSENEVSPEDNPKGTSNAGTDGSTVRKRGNRREVLATPKRGTESDSPKSQKSHSPVSKLGTSDSSKHEYAIGKQELGNNGSTSHLLKNTPAQHIPKEQSFLTISLYAGVVIAVAFIIGLVAINFFQLQPGMKTDFNYPKIFGRGLGKMESVFTNQTKRVWKILRNRGLAHLRKNPPPQPLVILLAAPPPAHDMVDCFTTEIAKLLDPKHKRTLTKIKGEWEKNKPGGEAKKQMDDLLITAFENGHRTAVVTRLELLPPQSPLLFYSYCDNENAPYRHVTLLFTVHLSAEPDPSLQPNEAEGMVEKYLADEIWSSYDQDAVGALLSRITDTVLLMNKESEEVLKTACS